jgi:hypothetical protein
MGRALPARQPSARACDRATLRKSCVPTPLASEPVTAADDDSQLDTALPPDNPICFDSTRRGSML